MLIPRQIKDNYLIMQKIRLIVKGKLRNMYFKLGYLLLNRNVKEIDTSSVKKILVIKFGDIGDMVYLTPTLKVLRSSFPNAKIFLLMKPYLKDFMRVNPNIDEIVTFNHNPCRKNFEKKSSILDYIKLILKLRLIKFDVAIEFRGMPYIQTLAYLSGSKYRLGYSEGEKNLFLTHCIRNKHDAHDTIKNLKVLELLKIKSKYHEPKIFLSSDDIEYGKKFKKKLKAKMKLLGIHMGAGWKPRKYPVNKTIEIINSLKSKFSVLIINSKDERKNLELIKDKVGNGVSIIVPKTVNKLCSIIANLDILLSLDSGPLHIAQAYNIPSVAIFGPGDYIRWGPFRKNSIMVRENLKCSPCGIEGVSTPNFSNEKCNEGYHYCKVYDLIHKRDILNAVNKISGNQK